MSTDNDVARSLRSWLREERHEDADRVLDLVFDQIPATPQRRASWLARRFPVMNNNLVRVALVAAVLLVAVIIGANLLPKPDVGPSPTPTPIPLPRASGPVAAGTYISRAPISGFAGSITFTIPDGWSQTWALQKGDLTISFWTVANLSGDACHWESTMLDPPLGPSVQDLVTGLEQQIGHPQITSAPVTVGGHSGQRVELDWPAALDLSQCDQAEYRIFSESASADSVRGNSVGYHSTLWIVDVEGTRLVIDGSHVLAASEAHRSEIQTIIDSMVIEPAS